MNIHLLKLIQMALRNAESNGYNFTVTSVKDIALDMQMYDSDIEHYSLEEIEECLVFLNIKKDE